MENNKLMKLGVENEILKKAEEIFLEVVRRKLLRGRSAKYMFYSSLYLSFRSFGIPKRLEEIQQMGNLGPKQFASSVRFLMKNLEMKLPPQRPKEWVSIYSRKLRVPDKTVRIALNLIDDIGVGHPLKDKSPVSILQPLYT